MSNTTKQITDAIKGAQKSKTSAYDTQAIVRRVEGNTAWVHIPGGVDETPVQMTSSAKEGDTVQVRVSGGKAWLYGNATSPPTDDTVANKGVMLATDANELAASASKAATQAWGYAEDARSAAATAETHADEAKASAQNASEYAARALGNLSTVQSVTETLNWITAHGTMALTTDVALDPTHVYFVVDAGGDYTVGGVTYAIVTEPDVADIGTYYELSIDESLNNYVGTHLALTSEGLWLLPASSGANKVLVAVGGVGHTYPDAGTYIIDSTDTVLAKFLASATQIGDDSDNNVLIDNNSVDIRDGASVMATFSASGAIIGENATGKTRTEIGAAGMQIIRNVSGTDTQIANLGFGAGADGTGTFDAPYFTFGKRLEATANYNSSATYDRGDICLYDGDTYICIHTIGTPEQWTASHWVLATANYSVAEGYRAFASGYASHAEGEATEAKSDYCHAEGYNTTAGRFPNVVNNKASHAEGYMTDATGDASHAQNTCTIAQRRSQTALGEFNIADTSGDYNTYGKYVVIIGNGTADNARSDALEIDWSGDVFLALDTTAASGTTDGDLYAAINALGWASAVIV